jgi:hypothetical protein
MPEAPPASVHLRPFWFMRILSKSIQSGGYITPKLYVPKAVWFQAGAKLSSIQTKTASWETINDCILRFKDLKEDEAHKVR